VQKIAATPPATGQLCHDWHELKQPRRVASVKSRDVVYDVVV
jgi:hypothetical protein